MHTLHKLTELMAALRDPENGCPWDIRQTSHSISHYTLEETYELLQAIDREDSDHIREELGDLLFHIVFHSQIARENGQFDIDDVIEGIVEKMTQRHPHVFDPTHRRDLDDEQLKSQWQQLKQKSPPSPERVLDTVDHKLPALIRAQKLQDAAAQYHFDWPDATPVLNKIEEEIGELREAIASGDTAHAQAEMGDVLFACVNLARHLDIDADTALRQTNEKFIRRFDYVVAEMQAAGIEFSAQQLEQMEAFWQQSKKVTG